MLFERQLEEAIGDAWRWFEYARRHGDADAAEHHAFGIRALKQAKTLEQMRATQEQHGWWEPARAPDPKYDAPDDPTTVLSDELRAALLDDARGWFLAAMRNHDEEYLSQVAEWMDVVERAAGTQEAGRAWERIFRTHPARKNVPPL